MQHHHNRPSVEGTLSNVKRKFHEAVRSKTPVTQKNEALCEFVC